MPTAIAGMRRDAPRSDEGRGLKPFSGDARRLKSMRRAPQRCGARIETAVAGGHGTSDRDSAPQR